MKYNDTEQWTELKLAFKDEKLKEDIKTNYNLTIHKGLQDKHIYGTANFNQELDNGNYKSYLKEGIDPYELVDKYACTGKFIRSKNGKWTNKEIVTVNKIIGYSYDRKIKKYVETNRFMIHYSKNKGTHVVPRGKEDNNDF